MVASVFPQNYEEWRHCIVVDCGLELTPRFIEARIASLNNESEHYTKQFIRLYGREYLETVLGWFLQAQKNL